MREQSRFQLQLNSTARKYLFIIFYFEFIFTLDFFWNLSSLGSQVTLDPSNTPGHLVTGHVERVERFEDT